MPTSVRLPEDIERRLDSLARQTGRTKAYYIREMILGHIDEMEVSYLNKPPQPANETLSMAEIIRRRFAEHGGVELSEIERSPLREPPSFDQ